MEGAKLHLYWAAKLGNIAHNNLAFGVMNGAWEQGLWNLHLWLIRDTEARKCMAGPALNEGEDLRGHEALRSRCVELLCWGPQNV